MKLKLLTAVSVFLIYCQTGFPITVNGIVFCDKNNNGINDKGEKVLSKIPVSNGIDIVTTDKNGFYTLQIEPGNSVFPILPSGYLMSGGKIEFRMPVLNILIREKRFRILQMWILQLRK